MKGILGLRKGKTREKWLKKPLQTKRFSP